MKGRPLKYSAEGYRESQIRKILREQLWYEQGGWCAHCDYWVDKDKSTLDHLIPQKVGGPDTWGNCVMSCGPCNSVKADHIPDYLGDEVIDQLTKEAQYKQDVRAIEKEGKNPRYLTQKRLNQIRNRSQKSDFMDWLDANPTPVRREV